MEHLISGICVLALVIVGLLIMTRSIAIEDIGNAIVRGFFLVIVLMILICLLKGTLAAIVSATIAGLNNLLILIVVVGLMLVAVKLVVRRFIGAPAKHSAQRRDHHGGEL